MELYDLQAQGALAQLGERQFYAALASEHQQALERIRVLESSESKELSQARAERDDFEQRLHAYKQGERA